MQKSTAVITVQTIVTNVDEIIVMAQTNLLTVLSLFIAALVSTPSFAGRCSGDAYCTACTNCSACKHCSQQGGSCGVCSSYDEPEPETPIVESQPVAEGYSTGYSPASTTDQNEGSSWGWWVGGILGFFVLIGLLGKK